jgi:hypothetical protein
LQSRRRTACAESTRTATAPNDLDKAKNKFRAAAMKHGLRIKTRMRRIVRRHPRIAFVIRSFVLFSAAFGGAYGFIVGSL